LFGGISRTVLDSMQEEIKYINDKMEDIKVEKSKINAKLDKKSEDLEKLQEDYKNLL